MSEWTKLESDGLTSALKRVRDENRFWPEQVHHNLINGIVPLAATEVAVVKDGKLLLQYRLFDEWPAPYNKPGWYIPGGYIPWEKDMRATCTAHIRKDLISEYRRANVGYMFQERSARIHDAGIWYPEHVELSVPVIIGIKKWMPGDHPFGCPISLICVCELTAGTIVETEWLKWSDKTIPTDVPWHRSLQDTVHFYLRSPPEMRKWLAGMHATIDAIT